jgi:hypothetical protein
MPVPATGWRGWNSDRIVSLTALVVGVGSLFTVVYQTYLTRQAQDASMLPYLAIAISASPTGTYITLANTGLGPALIEDVRVVEPGREFVGDPHDFYLEVGEFDGDILDVDKIVPGRLIPPGAYIQMLGTGSQAIDGVLLDEFLTLFEVAEVPRSWYAQRGEIGTEKAVLEITYASVYGDRWRLRSDAFVPEEL